ncbi:uncharacterized protein LOC124306842 [Neodiprion virginianus]|uniref:uncharacterized protein LOC124306842 n=1 Tax=Neodiprion virginianus TaxID=2961670 RepID=UPI001EE76571|nr:uncharacterized protein LOC124306842 [Neodiprion virginianus]
MVNLNDYERHVCEIKRYAFEKNIPESEVNKVFEECFQLLKISGNEKRSTSSSAVFKYTLLITLLSVLCGIISYNHPPTMNLLMRNSQNFIYPGMKFFRQLAVPILDIYPSITEWYDEWCLLENPYFQVADMDCQPCNSVHSIPDLSGRNISWSLNVALPFTRSKSMRQVTFIDLVDMYTAYKKVFDEDSGRITSNNNSYRVINDVATNRLDLYPTPFKTTHITWRINRMKPGRLLRKLFPKPAITPDWWGQSTEKFVMIDEPKSPAYILPNSECSNVVLRCGSGERLIKLVPSPECQQECRSSTVLLTARQTLWYNWWYWRPVSLPAVNSTSISISYLTSFC